MILMPSGHEMRLVTGSTATINAMVSYADRSGTAVEPDSQSTAITTATTTVICSAAGTGVKRLIRTLTIRNVHASASNAVTLQVFNGSAAFAIYTITLAAGEMMTYDDGAGWAVINAQGLPKLSQSQGSSSPASTTMNIGVLAADVSNANSAANTIADITGLSFPVIAGQTYQFEFLIDWTSALITTGARFSISGPAFSRLAYRSAYALTATTETVANLGVYDMPATANASPAIVGGNIAKIEGLITPAVDGNVIARFASEISLSAITAKAGSIVKWVRVL